MSEVNVEEILENVINEDKEQKSVKIEISKADIENIRLFLDELDKLKADLLKALQNTDNVYEKMQLKTLKANLEIIESLVVEYQNLTERIFQLASYYNERGIYDEQALVKAQETINSLYTERLKIKKEIINSIEKFQKHLLNLEKTYKIESEISVDELI